MSATPEEAGPGHTSEGGLDLASRIARAEGVARPTPRISRNTVIVIVVVFVVVGVTAGFVQNFLTSHVTAPTSATSSSGSSSSTPGATTATPTPHGHGLAAFMGITPAHGAAPAFRLVDQSGQAVSLASLRGKVVVVSFFDADCHDICPVLAAELRAADRDLGARAGSVAFLTVNSNPLVTGAAAAVEGASVSGLGGPGGLPNWRFLSGPLARLNTVWKRYGMTIDVQTATHAISHNDALWFISPTGRLAEEATPFADQRRSTGAFHLPAATEARFGAGIAHYARLLLPAHPAAPAP